MSEVNESCNICGEAHITGQCTEGKMEAVKRSTIYEILDPNEDCKETRPGEENITETSERIYEEIKDLYPDLTPEEAWKKMINKDSVMRAIVLNASTNVKKYNDGIWVKNEALLNTLAETGEEDYMDLYAEDEIIDLEDRFGWVGNDCARLLGKLRKKMGLPTSKERSNKGKETEKKREKVREIVKSLVLIYRLQRAFSPEDVDTSKFDPDNIDSEGLKELLGDQERTFSDEDWKEVADLLKKHKDADFREEEWWTTEE